MPSATSSTWAMLLWGMILPSRSHSCNLSWRSRLPLGSLLRADRQGSLQLLYCRQECSCHKNKSVNDPKYYAKLIPNVTRSVWSHAWRVRYQSPLVVRSLAKRRWLIKCAGPIFWCRPVSAYFLSLAFQRHFRCVMINQWPDCFPHFAKRNPIMF